jgi:ribosomal protein L24
VLPLLNEGDRVRVMRGPLAGVEGRLVRGNSTTRLAISIEMIHKSLIVSVSRNDVEASEDRATALETIDARDVVNYRRKLQPPDTGHSVSFC